MSDEKVTAGLTAPKPPAIAFGTLAFDTPDPINLATFYSQLLGWEVDPDSSDEEWVTVRGSGSTALAFQLAPDHVAPTWPDPATPQQVHLDLYVDDYEGPEAHALALGATLLEGSDDHTTFRVYADPSGHPFCLCLRRSS